MKIKETFTKNVLKVLAPVKKSTYNLFPNQIKNNSSYIQNQDLKRVT